jgi:taurine dioxygenase
MRRKNKALPRNYRFINVHPIAGALGAEIKGVNIALPLKREVVLEIRQAFLLELV